MREDLDRGEHACDGLIELGSASELTQGTFMPLASESVTLKDRFEE